MRGPAIPRSARLRLHALRDLKVLIVPRDADGITWLALRDYLSWGWVGEDMKKLRLALTPQGEALARLVIKPPVPRKSWETPR